MSPLDAWKELGYRILDIEGATSNVTDLARRINQTIADEGLVAEMIDNRFEREGPGWPALTAYTLKERERLGFGPGPMLVRSGTLQKAAIYGNVTCTPDAITMTLRDAAAPRYTGNGNYRKQRINHLAVARMDRERAAGLSPIPNSGRLSDYADRLNARRPFYGSPTGAELEPIVQRRNFWIQRIVGAIANGESLSQIGLSR